MARTVDRVEGGARDRIGREPEYAEECALGGAMSSPSRSMQRPLLLLTRSLDVGGAERQLIELAKALHASGRDVRVIVFYAGGPLESELHAAGIPVIDLHKSGRWDNLGFFLRLVQAVRRIRPVALYSYLVVPNIFSALIRPFVPRLKLVWGVRASVVDWSAFGRMAQMSAKIEALLSRYADLIICNSAAGQASASRSGFPSGRMEVVHNGIDTARFVPNARHRARQRDEWAIAEDEILIGVLARLNPMKDHRTFLAAAARLSRGCPKVRFICIGGGPESYQRELVQVARSLEIEGRVIWTGARNNPADVLPAFDIYCSSSSFGEGFSNSIAEAMACGVPCVVTDVGASALIVGDSGIVVPPSDPEALAEALKAMISRLGPELTRQARERIAESFSINAMADATMRLIDAQP